MIFVKETDGDHGLTMPQIIERLLELGVTAERKAIYRDIAVLQDFGMKVEKLPTSPVQYALVERCVSVTDCSLMIDALQGCPYLTKRKSQDLVRIVKKLVSKEQAKRLDKRVHLQQRVHTQFSSVFSNVDVIQRALSERRKVEFRLYTYGLDKEPQVTSGTAPLVVTPVELVYSDSLYHLIGYNHVCQDFAVYRVDRMQQVRVSKQVADRNDSIALFDIEEYTSRVFGMFSGEPVYATLRAKPQLMGEIIDRFGTDVRLRILPGDTIHVYERVVQTPKFYGWIAQFGNQIEIEGPPPLRKGYADFIRQISQVYHEDDGTYRPFGGGGIFLSDNPAEELGLQLGLQQGSDLSLG